MAVADTGIGGRPAGEAVRGIQPGRSHDGAALRRHRSWTCDHTQVRAHDGWRRDRGERPRQRLGVHGAPAGWRAHINAMKNLPRRRFPPDSRCFANRKSKRYSVHYTPPASWNQPMTLRDMQESALPTPQKLEFSAAEIGALAHLYRGEVYRSTAWRTRLDSTTNWAVVTTGIALSATFSSAEASPLPMVLVGLIVSVFLLFEARRYRYFNVWRARTRLLETDFYAPMIRGEGIRLGAGWTELLAKEYCEPRYHVSFARAIGRRLRRTYAWIFVIQAVAYYGKLAIHPA